MIVDTSALLAILLREREAVAFRDAIDRAEAPRMSVASYVEAAIRIDRLGDPLARHALDETIRQLGIEIVAVAAAHGQLARRAYEDYGKGRHAAGLNYGDSFVYALAAATGELLLFKGDDFGRTDLSVWRQEK